MVYNGVLNINTVSPTLQWKSPETLQQFVLHFKGVRPEQNDAESARDRALYATQLFGPLNDDRFKPGQLAQKTGGVLWRAWLIVEAELITSYDVYLLKFADYESAIKRIEDELKRSRTR